MNCDFCNPQEFSWRTIRTDDQFISFVPKNQFRDKHCMVIPRRHITKPSELTVEESATILQELGRLGDLLDSGFGSGIMQKYQPTQPENGIKMNHLHFHVFPRWERELGLFPVPQPNSFDGLHPADETTIRQLAEELR